MYFSDVIKKGEKMKNRFIAYYEGENNGYDDSDFYTMYLDTEKKEVVKHTHSTTRHGGYSEFPHEFLDGRNCDKTNEYHALAEKWLYENFTIPYNYDMEKGDLVKNTNPRARKHKEVEFLVTGFSSFVSNYGRALSSYALGVCTKTNQEVKVNFSNLSILEVSEKTKLLYSSRRAVGLRD